MTKHCIPWNKIKAEYLQGIKPKEIAEKYGLTPKKLHDKANEEKWVEERRKMSENVRDCVQDKIKNLTNKALQTLEDVLNNPTSETRDKISASKAVLEISGLKSVKQEITGNVEVGFPIIKILPVCADGSDSKNS
ncbi:MAG: hypothetical protein J1F17_01710 [Oscillospiraceae bacterium]|nr:hypothetical protein [Oscillospiraceae bacterium]